MSEVACFQHMRESLNSVNMLLHERGQAGCGVKLQQLCPRLNMSRLLKSARFDMLVEDAG